MNYRTRNTGVKDWPEIRCRVHPEAWAAWRELAENEIRPNMRYGELVDTAARLATGVLDGSHAARWKEAVMRGVNETFARELADAVSLSLLRLGIRTQVLMGVGEDGKAAEVVLRINKADLRRLKLEADGLDGSGEAVEMRWPMDKFHFADKSKEPDSAPAG